MLGGQSAAMRRRRRLWTQSSAGGVVMKRHPARWILTIFAGVFLRALDVQARISARFRPELTAALGLGLSTSAIVSSHRVVTMTRILPCPPDPRAPPTRGCPWLSPHELR